MDASGGKLTAEVTGEIELEGKVLVIKRILVHCSLRGRDNVDPAVVKRVHGFHASRCPVARSVQGAIESRRATSWTSRGLAFRGRRLPLRNREDVSSAAGYAADESSAGRGMAPMRPTTTRTRAGASAVGRGITRRYRCSSRQHRGVGACWLHHRGRYDGAVVQVRISIKSKRLFDDAPIPCLRAAQEGL
jgi:hypothetical protein